MQLIYWICLSPVFRTKRKRYRRVTKSFLSALCDLSGDGSLEKAHRKNRKEQIKTDKTILSFFCVFSGEKLCGEGSLTLHFPIKRFVTVGITNSRITKFVPVHEETQRISVY